MISVDFFPNLGGIAMMTHHLANALTAQGYTVTLLAPKGASVPPELIAAYRLVEDFEARPLVREHEPAHREDARIGSLLRNVFRAEQSTYDRILLMHSFYYGPGASSFARETGVPLSVFFYGFELRSQLLARQNPLVRVREIWRGPLSLRSRTLRLIAEADEILSISSYTARLLRTAGTDRPIHVTGCGLATADLLREALLAPVFDRTVKQKERRTSGLRAFPTVTFLGRLVESKNVELLLDALSRVDGVAGLIIGSGPEVARLRVLAAALGLGRRLQWIPHATEAQKWAYLRASDVVCLPSKETAQGQVEGFGIVLLEATAAATPVIAARSGGMTDVVEHGVTGLLCEPDEPDTLAGAIRLLLSDDTLSASCVERARSQMRERFNWQRIAQDLASRWEAAR
jgi:glycosyltransferase involved in cell wall biosynthesis